MFVIIDLIVVKMNKFNRLLIFYLIFASLIYSSEISNEKISVNVKTLNEIIYINMTESPSYIVPNYEYALPIIVGWNIPSSSLRNINANNITIFVKATVESGNEFVYFKDGNKKINTSFIVLFCDLDDTLSNELKCGSNSSLVNSIKIYVFSNSSKSNEVNSTILFSASLTPFEDFIPIYHETLSLQNQLNEIKKNVNVSDKDLENKINKTQEALNSFHIEEARTGITDLNLKTGNLLSLFSLIPNKFNSLLMSFFGFLSLNSNFYVPIILSIIIIISSIITNLRKGSKYGIIAVATLVILASIFSLLDPFALIIVDLVLVVLILSILYARKDKGKKRFRSNDNYLDSDYEELIKRRNR